MRKLAMSELERLSNEQFKSAKKIPIIAILDDIRSLNNIGSIFRTADAFRLEAIYLCGITAQPPHRDIHKTALGATESVDWKYFKDIKEAITSLHQKSYKIYGIEQTTNSSNLNDFKIHSNEKYALIFGNEVSGINDDIFTLLDGCIELPQWGTKHSLNVSVCAGIVLWKFSKSFKDKIK